MRYRPVLILVALLSGACSGAESASDVPTTSAATILPADPELMDAVYQNGINQVGLTHVVPERWYQLAEAGCRDGAWDAPVARTLADDFLVAVDQGNTVPLASMTDAVWLVTLTACRDLFPARALDAGPPSMQGG